MRAIDRIIQIIENQHISLANFETKCGLSSGYLSKMKKRSASVGEDILCKILEYCPNISPGWLLTGEGCMYRTDSSVTIGSNNTNSQIGGSGNTMICQKEEAEIAKLRIEKAVLEAQYKELEKRYSEVIGRLAGK